MEAKNIYDSICSLSDLVDVVDAQETAHIELKAVHEDLGKSKPAQIGDFKLRIAKEMCAFANTDAGVIAIGVDEKTKTVKNNTENLLEWLDKYIRHMLEPQLSGVVTKLCIDDLGGQFVLMYIPKGNAMPYRTAAPKAYETKKDIAREYYQRIGTHSDKIAMPIVRSLYMSNDRATRVCVESALIHMSRPRTRNEKSITFGLLVQPDPTKLITDYYLKSEVVLLDTAFNEILDEPIDISWWSINQPSIPPDDEVYVYNEHTVSSENPPSLYSPVVVGDDTYVPASLIGSTYAAYIKTSFACEGVPKTTDHRIIILGKHAELNVKSWNESSNWIDNGCTVVRYVAFSPDNGNMVELYAMENFIREKGLTLA